MWEASPASQRSVVLTKLAMANHLVTLTRSQDTIATPHPAHIPTIHMLILKTELPIMVVVLLVFKVMEDGLI